MFLRSLVAAQMVINFLQRLFLTTTPTQTFVAHNLGYELALYLFPFHGPNLSIAMRSNPSIEYAGESAAS